MEDKFHRYDEQINRLLTRIRGDKVGFKLKDGVNNRKSAIDLSKLTLNNRELLLRIHRDSIIKGNKPARQLAKLQRLTYNFLLFDDDVELASPEDFKRVVEKIMIDSRLNNTTKSLRIDELIRFDKEYFGEDDKPSERTKKIKIKLKADNKLTAQDILTEKEIALLINSTVSVRDRALISCIYAGGFRIGEIGNATVKDFNPSEKGIEARLFVDGKTGARSVLLVEGVRDVKDWLSIHPMRHSAKFLESPLFCQTVREKKGLHMNNASITRIISRTANRAGINKRVNPHAFRHARATHLCSKGLPEMQMRQFFGWAKNSNMPATYAHLSQKNVEDSLRKAVGMEEIIEEEIRCRVCGTTNKKTNGTCMRCSNPLSVEGFLQLKQEKEIIQQDRDISQKVFSEAIKIMQQQNLPVEEAQKEAIRVIAAQQTQGQRRGGG